MKLYVEERDMPKNCMNCPCGAVYFAYRCKAEQKEFEKYPFDGRQDWCPLVPVPPHGRLIDADALLERFEKEEKAADEHGRDFSFSFKSGGENCTEWWAVQQMLMDAPTIIPAEEA